MTTATAVEVRAAACVPPLTRVGAPVVSRRSHYLQPGQLLVCPDPTAVTTILGSCVSVCLWDRRREMGAINHYLLPHDYLDREQSLRCGPVAIARLVERMRELGSGRGDLAAKVFGGAWILAAPRRADHIGALNVRVAREELAKAGIPIAAEDVGGDRGRKIVFHTESGIALVRKL